MDTGFDWLEFEFHTANLISYTLIDSVDALTGKVKQELDYDCCNYNLLTN